MKNWSAFKHTKILGIPLVAGPGDRPGNAPDWVYKWWNRAINAWLDLMMGLVICAVFATLYALHELHQEQPAVFHKLMTGGALSFTAHGNGE